MSTGSEKLTWKHYPEVERVCAVCGKRLRIQDVRREHSSKGKRSLYCIEHVHEGYA